MESSAPWAARALLLSMRTICKLLKQRPHYLIVQNPSIILASVASVLRPVLRYKLIVDRHSNFFEQTLTSPSLKFRLFHILSRYTVRSADLTIVTNDVLKDLLEQWGGTGFVLPDKLPRLDARDTMVLSGRHPLIFICSHSTDEPIAEVLEAARIIGPLYHIYVTGQSTRSPRDLIQMAPTNVTFTGFLPEVDYQSLLASAHVVLVLTKQPNTLLCGAYEAVALGKPLILSNQTALTSYFSKGTVATSHDPRDIATAVYRATTDAQRLHLEILSLAFELGEDWRKRFDAFCRLCFNERESI